MGAVMCTLTLVLLPEFFGHLFKAHAWRWTVDCLCGSWVKLCAELCCLDPFSKPKFWTGPEF